jgi:hypothetical protein
MSFNFKPKITIEEYNKFEEINENNNFNLESNNENGNRNLKDITPTIMKLLKNLYTISWEDINIYLSIVKEFIESNYYKNSNKLFNFRILQYSKWKSYWNNIIKSWMIFFTKYRDISASPFQAFIKFNYEECDIFINWLELYSFTYYEYNNMIYEKEIPGSILFKKLKNILLDVIWLNNNINIQPMISIYIDKF